MPSDIVAVKPAAAGSSGAPKVSVVRWPDCAAPPSTTAMVETGSDGSS
jgi:hypothetical protein